MVLQGLDYLHTECHVIHADLKPDNVMVKVEDPSILERDARDEHDHPLPQKHIHGRAIYLSRNNYAQPSVATGVVQITDFDLSAETYRAPEVVLDAGYGYSADVWSLGVMLWGSLEGTKLFEYPSRDQPISEYDDQTHLTHITALLGPAPSDLLAAGRRTSKFHTPDGNLKNPKLIPAAFSFENTLNHVSGEGKRRFIDFVRKMIAWRPEDRMTARELLKDPWLHKDFPQG
ncbi:kinase-like domain-containing protein [Lasiosphaeria miniovina]|uniref:non-specific serine/threonine protein kinase n=1 Tax=Lasiosphaeria miniovina TaxID=1954250 RepID=A0AA40EAL1_9PEZI|nr:kinase-like domain-containing protein [Lasiosphaeria miniovina]KAK0732920.1 kinase-like domain-containing protein [Lasiosphaeria miniovina]